MIARRRWSELGDVRDLPLDLGLDVERWLSAPLPPLVAGDHELADLRSQPGVDGGPGEAAELLVHVERRLPAARATLVLRLQHLADFLVALAYARARARGRVTRRGFPVVVQPAAADLVVELAATGQREHGDHHGDSHHHEDHDPKGVLHTYSVPMRLPRWSQLRRKTFAPNRPMLWPEQLPLAAVTLLVLIGSIVALLVVLGR